MFGCSGSTGWRTDVTQHYSVWADHNSWVFQALSQDRRHHRRYTGPFARLNPLPEELKVLLPAEGSCDAGTKLLQSEQRSKIVHQTRLLCHCSHEDKGEVVD